mgnify:CR=1 FL=1
MGKGGVDFPALEFSAIALYNKIINNSINRKLGEKYYARDKKYAFRYYNNDCFNSVLFGL